MHWTAFVGDALGQSWRRVFGGWLAVLLTVSVCAAQNHAASESPNKSGTAAPTPLQSSVDYIVGPNDVLAITVVDQAPLTGKYIVRADGTFTFPLLGRLQAGGLSLQAIEDDVRNRLAKGYLKDPQIGVSVDQYRSQQIFVMGQVRSPGSLQFTGAMTVIEALARAGSTTEIAGSELLIVRQTGDAPPQLDVQAIEHARNAKDPAVIHVNLQTLQTGGLSENISLRSGDTLYVPRAESVFVSGQVSRAGEYPIRRGMTVRQVLALAGGVSERGSVRRIQIIRQVNGAETTVGAGLQDEVRPGDNIVVRERLY